MRRPAVAIIDSGGANIASLLYAFKRLGARAELTTDHDRIRNADRVLLPGVGAASGPTIENPLHQPEGGYRKEN